MMQINLLRFGCVRWTTIDIDPKRRVAFRALMLYDRPLELAAAENALTGKGLSVTGRPLGPLVKEQITSRRAQRRML